MCVQRHHILPTPGVLSLLSSKMAVLCTSSQTFGAKWPPAGHHSGLPQTAPELRHDPQLDLCDYLAGVLKMEIRKAGAHTLHRVPENSR